MIYCIWYPSGGFGHYINVILSLHGDNFHRPNREIVFGENGDSHNFPLMMPRYTNKDLYMMPLLDEIKNHAVLIDNGINDESRNFYSVFPGSKIIKLYYDDYSWPIVAQTVVIKVIKSDLTTEIAVDDDKWSDQQDWTQREKFFLYLRDHSLRHQWRPDTDAHNLNISDLADYDLFYKKIQSFGIGLTPFKDLWQRWWQKNQQYFQPMQRSKQIIQILMTKQDISLDHIKDVWEQAVIYYFIWLFFGKEVPHNDFAEFFSNTAEIREWLKI